MTFEPAGASERLRARMSRVIPNDQQLLSALPNADVSAQLATPGGRLADLVRIVMDGYRDRPAVAERAVELKTDPVSGRVVAELLGRFDTLTYGELWDRITAFARALTGFGVRPGDRVAIVGFNSIDYTVVDLAAGQIGAVVVPLQTSAPVSQLQPVVSETEPAVIAAGVSSLDVAVDLALTAHRPARLVVFDYNPAVDDQRDAFDAAAARLADDVVMLETLKGSIAHGASLPEAAPYVSDDPNPLGLLLYTSGSTGAPKGGMYGERLLTRFWRTSPAQDDAPPLPVITLNFMPMSHGMARGTLYATLSQGGIAYFAASSDLSTFLEDLALVRPTVMVFVPRVWEMVYDAYQASGLGEMEAHRRRLIGDRYYAVGTGSAPITAELKAWVEAYLDVSLSEGYGSTEQGVVIRNGTMLRPPVIDYKLVDVPELGYFLTDRPYPRGELLMKSEAAFMGYYRRPELTAEVFDPDGYVRTGDIVAELGPDHIQYLDRRNNVLKLSQGEFVAVARLETAYGASTLVDQIYVYGSSARSYLLAVIVPTDDAMKQAGGDVVVVKRLIADALRTIARDAELQSYEIPRDFIVETTPFTLENGLLTGVRKPARPQLTARYGRELEQLYTDLAAAQADEVRALREGAGQRPVLETVVRTAGALLGAASAAVGAEDHFADLGGDSLSALTFGNLLKDIFAVEIPVSVIVSPASDLRAVAAYIDAHRDGGSVQPTFASVHGATAQLNAADLTLDKFIDETTLQAAPTLPHADPEVHTVLLTGATGFLGRYLALEWLERMSRVGGKVICLVRGKSEADARARLDRVFDSGDPELWQHYSELAAGHLEVLAGDKGAVDLGLSASTWHRLADTVDLIVDPAALVNHVLPYGQLFGPNVVGTAELIRLALTTTIKPYTYISTIGVLIGMTPDGFGEDADVRVASRIRGLGDSYANGYSNSKWAGEVLLRAAHDLVALPVSVFRCDMILADTSYAGQLNVPDMFTRMILSVVASGLAPQSFYELDSGGSPQRAHYDGLPVEFIAEAVATLAPRAKGDYQTYHVTNPHDDGISMDTFVDWLNAAGHDIRRVGGYADWLARFETALRGLPEKQRNASLLPLIHNYRRPAVVLNGAIAPTDRFRAAVQEAQIGPDHDIPHVTAAVISKYVTDLQSLGLL